MFSNEFITKLCFDLSKQHGKEILMALAQKLNDEDMFDPDEGCDIWSCSVCGACGSWDGNMKQEMGKEIHPATEDEKAEYLWDIECFVCGHKEQKQGIETEP